LTARSTIALAMLSAWARSTSGSTISQSPDAPEWSDESVQGRTARDDVISFVSISSGGTPETRPKNEGSFVS
jgi:hypothetical protein